ncbi:unnamed protein product [Lathyrus sativus]|nr:unnamed protein product [Lathyrus sativus]
MVESVEEVKEAVWSFFKNKFSEPESCRSVLDGFTFNSSSKAEVEFLEAPFTDVEIKYAVWSCEGSKSPDSDGYNFVFIKKCWSILKVDITHFFIRFP